MSDINHIKSEFQDFWDKIDRKRDFTDYTMGECEILALKAKKLITPLLNDTEYKESAKKAVFLFDKAKDFSDKYHKNGNKRDSASIMDVLTSVKFGLEEIL